MKYLVIGDSCRAGEFVKCGPFLTFSEAACHAESNFDHFEDGSFLIIEWDEDVGWLSIWQSSVRGFELVAEQPGAELLRVRGESGGAELQPRGFRAEDEPEEPST